MLLDAKGQPLQDQLTEELLNNSHTKISLYVEPRVPSTFMAFVQKKGKMYWGADIKLLGAIKTLLYSLEGIVDPTKGGEIPIEVPENAGVLTDAETGDIILDPLIEMVKETAHRKIVTITLTCKDYKYILATCVRASGRKYEGSGKTILEACNNLFTEVNLTDFNIKKTLPEL